MKYLFFVGLVVFLSGCDFVEDQLKKPTDGTALAVQECVKKYDTNIVSIAISRSFCASAHSLSKIDPWEIQGAARIYLSSKVPMFTATIDNNSDDKILTSVTVSISFTDKDGKALDDAIEINNLWIGPGFSGKISKAASSNKINLTDDAVWCSDLVDKGEKALNCRSWYVSASKAVILKR